MEPIEILKDLVHRLFEYDPDSGDLIRKVTRSSNAKKGDVVRYKNHGYYRVNVEGKLLAVHRIAWCLYYGDWPKGPIDHINRVRTDNRIVNLREVTTQENSVNTGLSCVNSSGFVGVCWHKQRRKWRAYVNEDGRQKSLGLFTCKLEAAKHRENYLEENLHVYGVSNAERISG